jgi:AcrR family transcriptional regulator
VVTQPDSHRRRDLSRHEIAAEASRIMRQEGEAAVTMRRVAAGCGVTAMALYHHVGSKEGLLTLVVDDVIGEAVEGFSPGPDWRTSMVDFVTRFRAALLANPGAATVFLRRPVLSENLTRTTEILFAILQDGDVRPAAMAEAVDAIVLLMMGSVANDSTRPADVRMQLLETVPVEETPLLVEHIGAYSERNGERRFQTALSWLLDGIEREALLAADAT